MKWFLMIMVCTELFIFGGSVNGVTITPLPIDPEIRLDVAYTNGAIANGSLSFGLTALPTEVNATFLLGSGTIGNVEPGGVLYDIGDVSSAKISFGDALWTKLESFSMLTDSRGVTSLSYEFSAINTSTASGIIILNFPLSITGTDMVSGTDFEYGYATSALTISDIPEPNILLLFGFGISSLAFTRILKKRNKMPYSKKKILGYNLRVL